MADLTIKATKRKNGKFDRLSTARDGNEIEIYITEADGLRASAGTYLTSAQARELAAALLRMADQLDAAA